MRGGGSFFLFFPFFFVFFWVPPGRNGNYVCQLATTQLINLGLVGAKGRASDRRSKYAKREKCLASVSLHS